MEFGCLEQGLPLVLESLEPQLKTEHHKEERR